MADKPTTRNVKVVMTMTETAGFSSTPLGETNIVIPLPCNPDAVGVAVAEAVDLLDRQVQRFKGRHPLATDEPVKVDTTDSRPADSRPADSRPTHALGHHR